MLRKSVRKSVRTTYALNSILLFCLCLVLCCCPILPCCSGRLCCASKTGKGPALSFPEVHSWLNFLILIQFKQRKRKWAEIVIKGNSPGWIGNQSLSFNPDLRCVQSYCAVCRVSFQCRKRK